MDTHSTNVHEQNKNCYRHEIIHYDKGLFDRCVDMTYIITMDNSKRIIEFMDQLEEHKPSKTVTIQFNKGFRNCNKNIKKNTPPYDLTDSLRNIFVDAIHNNYQRILVFEDDFLMDKSKYNQKDIDSINNYILKRNPDIYTFGTLLGFGIPISDHHRLFHTYHTHAVIYGVKYMNSFIKDASHYNIEHCDQYWNTSTFYKAGYHKPICYQLFPETENSQHWGPVGVQFKKWMKKWKLDKTHEHYENHHKFFISLHWIILFSILLTIAIITIFIIKHR